METMKLRRFMRTNRREQTLFAAGLLAMAAARIALLMVPLRRILEATNAMNRRWPRHTSSAMGVRRAALRISQAAAYCPVPTTCLSRTLAAHFLMSRLGFDSMPRIGVSKADGAFGAHAWLECQDGIVIGDKSPDGIQYQPVPSLERFFT